MDHRLHSLLIGGGSGCRGSHWSWRARPWLYGTGASIGICECRGTSSDCGGSSGGIMVRVCKYRGGLSSYNIIVMSKVWLTANTCPGGKPFVLIWAS